MSMATSCFRRPWLRLGTGLLVLFILTGCATSPAPAPAQSSTPSAAPQEPPKQKVTITMWTQRNPDEDKLQQESAKRFMALNPHIEIQITPIPGGGSGLAQKLQLAVAGGNPSDIVDLSWTATVNWAARGALQPLDEFLAKDNIDTADLLPAAWNTVQWQGKVYGIPYSTDARGLFYNKKLFREAGLDPEKPPKDWNELISMAQLLTKKDSSGRLTQVGLMPTYDQGFFYAWYHLNGGGNIFAPDGRKVTVDLDVATAAMDYVARLSDTLGVQALQAFSQGTGQADTNPFYTGRLAMWMTGPWRFAEFAKYAPDLWKNDLGLALLPAAPGKNSVSLAGGFALMIPKGAAHPKEAWEFIKFYTSKEEQANLAKAQLWVPVRKSVANDPSFLAANPFLKGIVQTAASAQPFPSSPVSSLAFGTFNTALEEAVAKKKSSRQAITDAVNTVQKELDTFWSTIR